MVNYLDDAAAVGVILSSNASGEITITGLNAGSYTNISVTIAACSSNTLAGPFSLTDAGTPTTPTISSSDLDNIICQGTNLTLTSSNLTGNSWSTGETTHSITVSTSGDYSVTFTENGCSSVSLISNVSVVSCASFDENRNDLILLYPNPTKENLTLQNIDLNLFSSIELIALSGNVLQSWNISSNEENLSLKDIQAGSYFIKIKGKQEIIKSIAIL
jgi:hypothetical protein